MLQAGLWTSSVVMSEIYIVGLYMSEITGLAVGWINQVLTQGIAQRKRE